jgi:hypothetical protein
VGKKITLFAFCVLCITFALIGCGGGGGGGDTGNPVGPVAVNGPVANLSGTVKFSGKPLANVTVDLYKPEKAILAGASGMASMRGSILAQTKLAEGSYSTKTDSDGRYSFTAIPVGEYTLIAGKGETYQFAQTGVMLGSVTEQDAQLTPTGKVSGRLLLTGGQPVRGVWVYLAGTSYVSISDAGGNFTINHVPSGQNFTLDIHSTDGGTLQTPVNTINIGPAENKSLGDMTLVVPVVPVQQVSAVNGQVNVADSSVPTSALNALMVIVVSSGDNLPLIAYTGSSGNFSLNVKTAGSYNVSVVGGEFAVAPTVQTVAVSALGTTVSVPQPFVLSKPTVVLPPTTQFYTYGGTISKRSKAFNESDNAGVPLTLTSTDAAANVFSAVTSPTGSFTFSVPAGTYNLAVGGGYAFESTFANPVSISASTVLNNVIWVVPTQVFTANFIVSGSLAKVAKVNGETDESNVMVTLTPTTGDAVTFAGATTPTGSFAIRVPAGTYNLAITGAYKFETPFTNPVNVTAAVNVGTAIKVIPANPAPANYVVSGTALKTDFAPGDSGQGGVTVSLTATTGPASTYTGLTDASGNYSITVPAGTYNLSVVSSIYRPESALAQVVVTNADVPVPSFNLQPIQAPVVVYTVDGSINKTDFIEGETDDGGVIITLTNTDASAKLYSTVTTAGGAFSFKVEPGIYTLAINSGYKFATTFSNPVDASAGNVNISPVIDVMPLATKMFTLSGSINKTIKKAGESNNGDLTVTLKSDSATFLPQTAVTEVNGSFAFKVPAGNYAIEVGNGYVFVSPPSGFPYSVTNVDVLISPAIAVRPAGVVLASIAGSVTLPSPNNHYRVRIEKTDGTYTDNETTEGAFYFNNLTPGSYRIVVLPDANGYYVETASPIVITEGQHLDGISLAPTQVAPSITGITPTESVLTISGSNFESLPVSITSTKILVDGNLRARPAAFTPTDVQEQAMIVSVTPGQHNVIIEKQWTRPGTTETFVLKSAPYSFDKLMGSPSNVAATDITDTSARISWTNANFTSKSIVDVYSGGSLITSDVLDGTSFQVTGLLASTSYIAHVYNRYGDIESAPTTVNFNTKGAGFRNPTSLLLADTSALVASISNGLEIFGFELMNDKIFVAYRETQTGLNYAYINSYDASGNQLATFTISAYNMSSLERLDMCVGNNSIYITYPDLTLYQRVQKLNEGLVPSGAAVNLADIGVDNVDKVKMEYHGNSLFLSVSDIGTTRNCYVYEVNQTLTGPANQVYATTNNLIAPSAGYWLMTTADANTGALYIAVASGTTSAIDNLTIIKKNLSNPTAAGAVITEIYTSTMINEFLMKGSDLIINDASAGFYRITLNTGYARLINTNLDPNNTSRNYSSFGVDMKGRFWSFSLSDFKELVNISDDGFVVNAIKIQDAPITDGTFVRPGEFSKLQTIGSPGKFGVLYIDRSFQLAVFGYESSF